MEDFYKLKKSLRNTQYLVVILIGVVVVGFALGFMIVKKNRNSG